VSAPIAGRIGRALVTEGALVSATEATQLALIQQTSTVYVNFTQSATELQRLRKDAGAKGQAPPAAPPSPCCSTTAPNCRARASCCSPT
jgi:membrane fusion protein (multidrug efflux system)